MNRKLIVEYRPIDGFLVADAAVIDMGRLLWNYTKDNFSHINHIAALKYFIWFTEHDVKVATSSEMLVLAIRVLVRRGEIPWNMVEFHFENHVLNIDANGKIWKWPTGFCDTFDNLLTELI